MMVHVVHIAADAFRGVLVMNKIISDNILHQHDVAM